MAKSITEGKKLYELGFHIVPSVAEERLPAEFGALKTAIEKAGGAVVSEEFPKLRPLAYSIAKKTGAIKHTYDKAYFGWVTFECDPAGIPEFSKDIDTHEHILRSLLIVTTKEAMSASVNSSHKGGSKTPISEAELDKSIDALVNNQPVAEAL